MKPFPNLHNVADDILFLLSNSCTSLHHIRQIQTQLLVQNLHTDTTLSSRFINTCHSLNLLHYVALPFFTHIPKPHVFICNTLIRAFSHSQTPRVPFLIYCYMHKSSIFPNNYTFPFVLKSLSDFRELKWGRSVHTHVVKYGHTDDIYVNNSLLSLYACGGGDMGFCRQVFDEMPQRDAVSWTVLITGYRNFKKFDDALIAFEQMQYAGVEPNRVTMVNALAACASYGAVEMGTWIHDFVRRKQWEMDVILGTALIAMYAACGRIEEGLKVFLNMKEKSVFTWNAVIKGLALAKSGEEAVLFFNRMIQEGVKVDDVTLLAVLSACSHSGLVVKGREIFDLLVHGKYGIFAGVKHYACMIDLLARGGYLEDAIKLINEMHFEPSKSMWGSLLAGCRTHGRLDMGAFAARKLVELEPGNGDYYVMLANLYAEMGKWREVEELMCLMKERGLKKDSGHSCVETPPEDNLHELLA